MKTMGIIAGNGRFPILVAEEAKRAGYRVVTCAIEQEAEPALEKLSDAFSWVKVGELKKLSKFLKDEGAHEAIMAGKIEKVRFFKENVRLDLDMMAVLVKLKDHKDDSLLGGIADYLFKKGIVLQDSTCLLKGLMPGPGLLGKKKPSKAYREQYGHTPLSADEEIPWGGGSLVVGTGAYGQLPIMKECFEAAEKRDIEIVSVPTDEACKIISEKKNKNIHAILHVTC